MLVGVGGGVGGRGGCTGGGQSDVLVTFPQQNRNTAITGQSGFSFCSFVFFGCGSHLQTYVDSLSVEVKKKKKKIRSICCAVTMVTCFTMVTGSTDLLTHVVRNNLVVERTSK